MRPRNPAFEGGTSDLARVESGWRRSLSWLVGEDNLLRERRRRRESSQYLSLSFPFPSALRLLRVSPPSLTSVTPLAPPTLVDVIPAVR